MLLINSLGASRRAGIAEMFERRSPFFLRTRPTRPVVPETYGR